MPSPSLTACTLGSRSAGRVKQWWGTRPLLSSHLGGGSQMLDVAGLPQSEFIPRFEPVA